jgi:hypothetical protein
MEAAQNKSGATIQFVVGNLVVKFVGIFQLYCSVQKLFKIFMLVQRLKFFSNSGGKYDSSNFLLKSPHSEMALP